MTERWSGKQSDRGRKEDTMVCTRNRGKGTFEPDTSPFSERLFVSSPPRPRSSRNTDRSQVPSLQHTRETAPLIVTVLWGRCKSTLEPSNFFLCCPKRRFALLPSRFSLHAPTFPLPKIGPPLSIPRRTNSSDGHRFEPRQRQPTDGICPCCDDHRRSRSRSSNKASGGYFEGENEFIGVVGASVWSRRVVRLELWVQPRALPPTLSLLRDS